MSDRNLLLCEEDCIREAHKILNEHHLKVAQSTIENVVNYLVGHGYVITVEQMPLAPLAMGNYEHVVSVRRKSERK